MKTLWSVSIMSLYAAPLGIESTNNLEGGHAEIARKVFGLRNSWFDC